MEIHERLNPAVSRSTRLDQCRNVAWQLNNFPNAHLLERVSLMRPAPFFDIAVASRLLCWSLVEMNFTGRQIRGRMSFLSLVGRYAMAIDWSDIYSKRVRAAFREAAQR